MRPVEEVARYLAGGRPVSTVQPPSTKSWDLEVVVPIPDMADPGATERPDAPGGGPAQRGTASDAWTGQKVDAADDDAEGDDAGDATLDEGLDDTGGADSGDDLPLGTGPVLPDLEGGGQLEEDVWAPAPDPEERASIWPHIERRVTDLVSAQTSTLVFTNSRRVAERFTSRLNEEWDERHSEDEPEEEDAGAGDRHTSRSPAQVMAQSGSGGAAPPVLARAHHGSVSKEQRGEIEDALKTGQLPAVVATSSLELGIDMGAVDLVVQVASPPSVASGLQRVGRAGHQVGATSHGAFFPTHRADLVQTAVVVDRMRAGAIEQLSVPSNPLDVLAQQVVAMLAMEDWSVTDLFELVRRTASYAALPRSLFDAVLDMLAGRYPGEDFADLRPRIVWDRVTDTLSARRGAQLLAVTSGGTIPDRGMYAVMLATGEGPGRRVGELDEEMVYESRVGDVFTLGTTSWRIEDITHDQVLVTPARVRSAGCRSGRASRSGGPPSWARPWASSCAGSRASRRRPPGASSPSVGWTASPPTTSSPTSPTSARPSDTSRTTGPSSSSASVTRSATGGSSCTHPGAARSTPPGRCAWRPGCASASAPRGAGAGRRRRHRAAPARPRRLGRPGRGHTA